MKAYTNIEQSKKLAEILPFNSADMKWFIPADNEGEFTEDVSLIKNKSEYDLFEKVIDWNDAPYIPCWSLSALLDVLESEIDGENGETYKLNIEKDGTWWDVWYSEEHNEEEPIETTSTEELVGVCVNVILELKKRNLL